MASSTRHAHSLARLMRILGDPTCLRLLMLLGRGEMNVGQLCSRLRVCHPTISHHLGLLRLGDLVMARREGKEVFYSLRPPRRGRASAGGDATKVQHQESQSPQRAGRSQRKKRETTKNRCFVISFSFLCGLCGLRGLGDWKPLGSGWGRCAAALLNDGQEGMA